MYEFGIRPGAKKSRALLITIAINFTVMEF